MDLEALILEELRYFDSEDQRRAFLAARTSPAEVIQSWSWGAPDDRHTCIVIARDARCQIVWCPTGFGPSFPWSVQAIGETDLGMDCDWDAYLYEAFVSSTLWSGGLPEGFIRMVRGDRASGAA